MKHSLLPSKMCVGKYPYPTKKHAQNALSQLDAIEPFRGIMNVYKCSFCSKYHIGNRSSR